MNNTSASIFHLESKPVMKNLRKFNEVLPTVPFNLLSWNLPQYIYIHQSLFTLIIQVLTLIPLWLCPWTFSISLVSPSLRCFTSPLMYSSQKPIDYGLFNPKYHHNTQLIRITSYHKQALTRWGGTVKTKHWFMLREQKTNQCWFWLWAHLFVCLFWRFLYLAFLAAIE